MSDSDEGLVTFLNARIDGGEFGGPAYIQAARAIIILAEEANQLDQVVDSDRGVTPRDYPYVGDQILRWLAWPHEGHPDYRDEWVPILPDSVDV